MIIDAHFHAWRPARGDYGWLTPDLGAICRDVEVVDWQAQAAPHGVAAGVLVQAAPTEAETTYLLQQADASPTVLGVVGWTDLLAADAPVRIGRLAQQPKLKGLRPMLQDLHDPDWILQPALAPALDAMAAAGLAFDALVHPLHLRRIRVLAQRHPDLNIVVDHGAKPDIAQGRWQPWADDLELLAAMPQVHAKLSGLLTEAGPLAHDEVALRPWIDHLLSIFGPRRLLWGSDWPVLERASTYSGWWAFCQAACSGLSTDERAAVFGDNARRFYRLIPARSTG